MKSAVAELVKHGLLQSGYYRRALARSTFPGAVVLCYHGIRDDRMAPGAMAFQYLHMPISRFESHCRLIQQCCDPISLDDWRAAVAGRLTLPKRPVLITFDDGYRSVLRQAAPILASHKLPAAVFVCTGPMETGGLLWFDDVAVRDGQDAVEHWKSRDYAAWSAACANTSAVEHDDPRALMSASELATLARMPGIEIGGHTVNHPILSRATADDQRREIVENLKSIHEWSGKPVRAFAYPNGRPGLDYNADTMAILRDAGIDVAFTTREEFARLDGPPLEGSRFVMLDTISGGELAHRMAYSWRR
jgi:peptidoglycan/xylan/chitin deacetylase (PgdA/CDA1 family)